MADSNTRIVLVVCNDYGELAFALYLLAGQPFAQNTTLLLPPRLYEKNPEALPGRTAVYNSFDDVRVEVENSAPGILGLFSGYLLPVHQLCSTDELESLLTGTRAQGWKHFTSDPFLGLLAEVDPAELIRFRAPKLSILASVFTWIMKAREAAEAQVAEGKNVLVEMQRILENVLHLYPCGESPRVSDKNYGARLHFHNPAICEEPDDPPPAFSTTAGVGEKRWLFVLGDEDYAVQEEKYGRRLRESSRKFHKILLRKMHETLKSGRVPTLIAPPRVIEALRKSSPAAKSMELLPHCEYSEFEFLLRDAEYVFYWNAVSFSCILRTLTGKPWFTFDDGHLLRGMNDAYAGRIFDWFYRGDEPPRLDVNAKLSVEALLDATQEYLKPAWRIRHALLESPQPDDLFSALDPERAVPVARPLEQAFDVLQRHGTIVAANGLDGNCVVDTALLAYPKSGIQGAIELLIERGNEVQVEVARSLAPTLAFFQPGVGAGRQEIDSTRPDGTPWRAIVEAEMRAIVTSLQG